LSQKFLGLYKEKEVFIEKLDDGWSMVLKHPKHGDLVKTGIKYKPKIGMAKRFFYHKLKHLNNESESKNVSKMQQRKLPDPGSGERLSIEEIESWINPENSKDSNWD
jgi:hypothetical protein